MSAERLRLDKWLWHARFYKSRTLAAAACAAGRIRLSGTSVDKAHQAVKPGDVLTFPLGTRIRVVRIVALGSRRGPAVEARTLYEDLSPPTEDQPGAGRAATPVPSASRAVVGRARPNVVRWIGCGRVTLKAIPHNPMEGDVERPAPVVLPIFMFRRLLGLFDDAEVTRREIAAVDPLQRAAAVLLVIAARLDGRMDSRERAIIERLLDERLGVTEAATLIEAAEEAAADTTDFFGVTRIINKRLQPEQRVDVIEMLWRVVYADGAVHDYEANLIRRVAGLLHVSDRDAGDARKRVTAIQEE